MSQLLVEIQCEELPASFIRPALESLQAGLIALLDGIEHGEVRTYATPRRLAVVIDGVAGGRPLVEKVVLGPPVSSAFRDGQPTKVAEGFARGKGVEVSALEQVEGPKGLVIAARVQEGGESTATVVADGLQGVVLGIPFKKSMEWGDGGVRWARPLHRVNAVFGGETLRGEVVGLPLGSESVGHRLAASTTFSFVDEATWLEGLAERQVDPNLEHRKAHVRSLVLEGIGRVNGDPDVDADLLEEVTHLVEAPTLVCGSFDPELLALPPRLLIKAMKAHQRYFPIVRDGVLTEHFVVISNNPWGEHDTIARGNANVLRARFHDAKFFFAEDGKKRLEVHGAQLEKMRWIRGLGSVHEKAVRVAALAAELAPWFGADPEHVERAGVLCKADLATQMVGEFADLQGHMGRLYAVAQGEHPAVAAAIEEHYQPAFAGDAIPASPEGAALALADRLDTLVGCFGVGLTPKGSGDPQGLRRAAQGVLAILKGKGVRTTLAAMVDLAVQHFAAHAQDSFDGWHTERKQTDLAALSASLVEFFAARFKASFDVSNDLVDAVITVGEADPLDWEARLDALVAISDSEDFLPIMHTFKRVLNITKGCEDPCPTPAELDGDAEQALYAVATTLVAQVDEAVDRLDYPTAFSAALSTAQPVHQFFEDVLVEDPDSARKTARKGLLLKVGTAFRRLADFSLISTR